MSKRKPRNKLYGYTYCVGKEKEIGYFLDIGDGWMYHFDILSGKFKHTWIPSSSANPLRLIGKNFKQKKQK